MHIIHIKETEEAYDTFYAYTNDEKEIELLEDLAIKIFGRIEAVVCVKSEHALILQRFDFFNSIPDDYTIFYSVNGGANEYDPRFVNDKNLAKMVAENTNNKRVRAIADMFANKSTDIKIESLIQYDSDTINFISSSEYIEKDIPHFISTPTGLTL